MTTDASHPEEMKPETRVKAGPFSFEARARTTPAGLIGAAVLFAALLVPIAIMVRRPKTK